MNDLGAALVRAPGWDWGCHVRAGMLFHVHSGVLRVRGRRGAHVDPGEPDPHDVLTLVRGLGRGAPVRLALDDPATLGWVRELAGLPTDDSADRLFTLLTGAPAVAAHGRSG